MRNIQYLRYFICPVAKTNVMIAASVSCRSAVLINGMIQGRISRNYRRNPASSIAPNMRWDYTNHVRDYSWLSASK